MTPPPTLQELIDTVRQDARTDDPLGQLAVAAATASDLEQTTDALLGHFVDRCRRAGRSWSEISAALGVTKQAVHKRFAGPLAERLTAVPGTPTFERFTLRARNVVAAANASARASGHREIEAGHLLLALYAEPDSVAAKALAGMDVARERVEATLLAAWADTGGSAAEQAPAADAAGPETGPVEAPDQLPMAASAKAALRAAVTVALELGHNYIGTEHILLGLYWDPDSPAARVLAEAGAELSQAKARLAELLHDVAKPYHGQSPG